MLHAVNSRKARLAAFRGAGLRVPLEDVVTSSIFGPLDFMNATDRKAAIELFIEALAIKRPAWSGEIRLLFWKKRAAVHPSMRKRYVEPDLIVADDKGARMVVEIKWGAPLGKQELAAQWSCLSPAERSAALHVLLVREPSRYRADIAVDGVMLGNAGLTPWRIVLCSWSDLARLDRLRVPSPRVRQWALAVADLLQREEQRVAHGWQNLMFRPVQRWFCGFRRPWFDAVRPVPRKESRFYV